MGGCIDTVDVWRCGKLKKNIVLGSYENLKERIPQHFQDKIRWSLFGEEVVESERRFRRDVLYLLLVGRNMLNVSVCLGLLFPGGLI